MSRTRSSSRAAGLVPADIPLPPARNPKSRKPASAAAGPSHPVGSRRSRSGTRTPGAEPRNTRGEQHASSDPPDEDPDDNNNVGNVGEADGYGDDEENGDGEASEGAGTDEDERRIREEEDIIWSLPANDRLLYKILDRISVGLAPHNSPQPAPKTPKVAIKEPTPFNGKEPSKLNEFIFQCRLYFDANPRQFPSEHTKVSFALSYLSGNALTWFQTSLEDNPNWNAVSWYNDWELFIEELNANFGSVDPISEATEEIEHLTMATNDHVSKYNVSFARLAGRLHWPDSVLVHRYYRGLPDCIQDTLSSLPTGKPTTMREMREPVMRIDNRHWECQRERNRSNKQYSSKEQTTQSQNKGKNKAPNSGSSQSQSQPQSAPNSNNQSKPGKPSNSKSTSQSTSSSNPLANVLGKSGKLTPQERQRRKDRNLCMFCGSPGHTMDNCSKKSVPKTDSSTKPKGRSVNTDGASTSTAPGTSGN